MLRLFIEATAMISHNISPEVFTSRGACSCGDQRKVFSGATRGII